MFLNPPFKFKISRDSRWPEYTKSGTLYYPIWLSYAAGVSKEMGFDVFLYDAVAKSSTVEETNAVVGEFDPDLLVVDTTTPTFHSDLKFVERLDTSALVVLVGTHVSALPDMPFKKSSRVGFVARGEYDYIIPELARNINSPEKVKGVSYRNGKTVVHNPPAEPPSDLDKLPWVSKIYKEFLNPDDYAYALARKPMLQLYTSRGCPNMCTFCQYPQVFSGRKFRARSPEDVVAEFEWIGNNLPEVKEIFIEDDTFTIDKQRVERICELIEERNLRVRWSANVRADLSYELMRKMKQAGARLLVVGYESGDNGVLKNIKKGITTDMSRRFAKNARKAGLKVFGCFMIGLPGDTSETVRKTFELAKELDPDMAFFQQAVPFPGTEMYNWAAQNKYLVTEDYSQWLDESGRLDFLLDYPDLPREDIARMRDDFLLHYNFRPSYITKTLLRNLSPSELERVVRAGFGFLKFWADEKLKRRSGARVQPSERQS